jgi:hypothetical protein
MTTTRVWNPVRNHPGGFLTGLSENMVKMEEQRSDWLTDIRSGTELLIASDYAGDRHAYQSLSFLLLSLPGNEKWDSARADFRRKWLTDSRRIEYKGLKKNSHELEALPAFLDAADSIHGVSITFLLNKNIQSVIADNARAYLKNCLSEFSGWKIEPFEKLFRITHFIAFLIAGLSRPSQNVWWLTDEDEIAANQQRFETATRFLAGVSKGFLTHHLGSLHCRTDACDDGTGDAKDLTSIPDLVAGALAEAWNKSAQDKTLPAGGQSSRLSPNVAPKALKILHWLSQKNKCLKKLVCVVNPRSDPSDQVMDCYWPEFQPVSGQQFKRDESGK